jgi:hypothetical protein
MYRPRFKQLQEKLLSETAIISLSHKDYGENE